MLKQIYKLQKKKGMVLFFVVMMMALLIIMSTAAYYTARSSYNTVVSNYDFEQMYLSATAISDLIMDVVNYENTSTVSSGAYKDSAGATHTIDINQFYTLTGGKPGDSAYKGALERLRNDAFVAAFAAAGGGRPGNIDEFDKTITIRTKLDYDGNDILTASDTADTTSKDAVAAAINSSVKAGVLDGAYSVITFKKATRTYMDTITPPATPQEVEFNDKYSCQYTITTTAFYRNNYIIVQDVITEEGVTVTSKYDYTPPQHENSSDPWTDYKWKEGNGGNGPGSKTFFTATGQTINPSGGYGDGGRSVVIKAHEISDNAYFENEMTYFIDGNNNEFKGGIHSSGSIYLDKFTTNIPAPSADNSVRHDWIIDGDLIIGGTNANGLNLNGNNLYVKGNIIIMTEGFTLDADSVYAGGNLYNLTGGQCSFNANVYIDKNVNQKADDYVNNIVQNARDKFASSGYTGGTTINPQTNKNTNGLNVNMPATAPNTQTDPIFKVNGQVNANGKNMAATTGTWGGTNELVAVERHDVTDDDGNVVMENGQPKKSDKSTLNAVFSSAERSKEPYKNTSISSDTLRNNLTIDLKNDGALENTEGVEVGDITNGVDGNGSPIVIGHTYDYTLADGTTVHVEKRDNEPYKYEFTAANSAPGTPPATATYDTQGTLVVDIPYNKDGYNLDINYGKEVNKQVGGYWDPNRGEWGEWVTTVSYQETDNTFGNMKDVTYNFGTKDGETMPVVLKANFNDGTATTSDAKGNNAFAWKGTKYGNQGGRSIVQLVDSNADGTVNSDESANGNVAFALGDYTKTNPTYIQYNVADAGKIETATYYTGQNEAVGTKNQIDHIGTNYQNFDRNEMLESGSVPKAKYDNRLIISSNKLNGRAVDGARLDNTICGYIWAPNSYYDTQNINGGNQPIFGGMIVSGYTADLSHWIYAEPNAEIIDGLLSQLGVGVPGKNGHYETIDHAGTSEGDEIPENYNFNGVGANNGDSLGVDGKNYLG